MFKFLLCFVLCCTVSSVTANPLGRKEISSNSNEHATPEKTASELAISKLNLPSNATSIRADITDSGFTCENKSYGYYADIENDCQIFHVCLPVTYADGKSSLFRWSFICPEETIFSQDSFTCMRADDMLITCDESAKYFDLNGNFGAPEQSETSESSLNENVTPIKQNHELIMMEKEHNLKIKPNPQKPINNQSQSSTIIKNAIIKNVVHEKDPHEKSEDLQNIDQDGRSDLGTQKKDISESNLSEITDAQNKEVLRDTSAESDVLSTLIDSFTKDLEPSDEPTLSNANGKIDKVNSEEANENFEIGTENLENLDSKTNSGIEENYVNREPLLKVGNAESQSQNEQPSISIPVLSVDDVVGLVKDSLDNIPISSNLKDTSEEIKPMYNRNEDSAKKDSKIIIITNHNEQNGPQIADTTNSKIIPVEIIEPISEKSHLVKSKARRHLRLSLRKK